MRRNILFPVVATAVLLFGATIICAEAQTPIITAENKTASVGELVKINVTMTEAPEGLSGYNLSVALSGSLAAEIESVQFPDWAILKGNSTLPAGSGWIKAIDLYKQVEANATNIPIATLLIRTKSTGTSTITVTKTRLDDDSGYTIDVITKTGYITVTDFAANDNVTVCIPAITLARDATVTVPITVYNVTDLGAGTLTVTYNQTVCTVTDVTAGDLPAVIPNLNTSGIAIVSAFDQAAGHTGTVTLANLKINAAGNCGDSSHLNTAVESLKTYGPPVETIPATNIGVSNGTLTIVDEVAPSVTNPAATPAAILNDNSRPRIPGTNRAQLNVTVTDDTGIDTVTIDVSPIGGSAAEEMTNIVGTDIWTVTVNAPAGINHTHNLIVTATDTSGNSDTSVSIPLTVLRRGDVLRDDVVDIGDALYLLQWTTGDVSDPGVFVGDVNPATGDELVNAGDALYIVQWTTREVPEP